MIHEKNLKQKVSWHCPYKAVSFNEEYSTHGSGEFILLSVAHGVKMAETGKINSETNRQKTTTVSDKNRETDSEAEIGLQTDRLWGWLTDGWWKIDMQSDRQTGGYLQTGWKIDDRPTDRHTDRYSGRQDAYPYRQTDRQAGRQTDRQADRQTVRQNFCLVYGNKIAKCNYCFKKWTAVIRPLQEWSIWYLCQYPKNVDRAW